MAPFTDIPEQQVIYIPKEAIRLWKISRQRKGFSTFPANWLNLCASIFFGGIATTFAMAVCLWIEPTEKLSGLASDSYMSAAFGIFLVTSAISAVLVLRTANQAEEIGHHTGYTRGVRTAILHGTGYDDIDPADCGIHGWDDTFEHKYRIKPLEDKPVQPPTTANTG